MVKLPIETADRCAAAEVANDAAFVDSSPNVEPSRQATAECGGGVGALFTCAERVGLHRDVLREAARFKVNLSWLQEVSAASV